MVNDTKDKEVITLKNYLEKNKDLLSILGVFIAIAVFSGNLSIKLIAAVISFCAFTCATLILIEFWKQPVAGRYSLSLHFFRIALFLLAFSFFLYWFAVFDAIYPDMIFPVTGLILIELWGLGLKKLKEKISRVERTFKILKRKRALGIFVAIVLTFVVLFIARTIANATELPIFRAVVKIIEVSSKIQGSIQ